MPRPNQQAGTLMVAFYEHVIKPETVKLDLLLEKYPLPYVSFTHQHPDGETCDCYEDYSDRWI